MKFINAKPYHLNEIYSLVKDTISSIYPLYYPKAMVDFFLKHHSIDNISIDINNNNVWILYVQNKIVGTGTVIKNNINRLFVSTKFQHKGYGSLLMKSLECEISKKYNSIYLDTSIPASIFYEKLGYSTKKHCIINLDDNYKLIYEVMSKQIYFNDNLFNYNNKIFIPKSNSVNGEVSNLTKFHYYPNKDLVWADYSGGDIIKGTLLGTVNSNGIMNFHYQHINLKNEIKIGKCESTPLLKNDKIELHEKWQWLNGDLSTGTSVLIEK